MASLRDWLSGVFWKIDTASQAGRVTLYNSSGTELSGLDPKNWAIEVARGNISGQSMITKFGYNADIDTAAAEDVFGQGGTYVAPTQARVHDISSSSANDTSAGTGARTVLVRGIDSNYNSVSETIILNGVGNVATVNSYHIHLMQVITVGSTGSNVGTISATAQTDATVTCTIEPTNNQSTSSIYMVPTGYKGYIMKIRARMGNTISNTSANVDLLVKPFGGGFQLKTKIGLNNAGSSTCLLYTSPSPRDRSVSRMPSSA